MSASGLTRIAVASDQPIFLRGLVSMLALNKEYALVGEGRSSVEAQQLCQMTRPDILLLDLKHIFDDGLPMIRRVYEESPTVKIVILLNEDSQAQTPAEWERMPVYFFSREINEDEFREALAQVRADRREQNGGQGVTHFIFDREHEDEDHEPGARSTAGARAASPERSEENMAIELAMAGKIQADLLPEDPPIIRGWEIAATLAPARETSGDFYDFIPLAPRKWGVVVADVSDKGMGAALLMALSSTLFRTYAARFPTLPAVTLGTISERILSDTRGGMFITALFVIFEPHTGRLVYANAGHPPGYLIALRRGKLSLERMRPTGMALGVSEQARWHQRELRMSPGDMLVFYTDGITETQNPQGQFYGEDRLVEVILEKAGRPPAEVQAAILSDVKGFFGGEMLQDDVALIVLRRQASDDR